MLTLTNLLDEVPEGRGAVESILRRTSVGTLEPLYELSEGVNETKLIISITIMN
jgi:hypothetical protein